ncbi:MAG: VWA domain-containing protein [Planctomycetes bacterium]|nr:VWA domain-containing protein [Planctomycetota bacterium]
MNWITWLLGIDRGLVKQYERWEIRWQAIPKAWVIVLILIPLVMLIPGYFYKRENKTAGGGARLALSLIRSAIIAVLLLALFQPILYLERELTKESYLVVLVDESLSMQIKDKYTEDQQFEALARVTADASLGAMGVPTEDDKQGPYKDTAIGSAIDSVLKELHGQPIAAMVIITDGRNTEGTDPADMAAQLADRGTKIPIYTVGVGNPLPPKDISLSKLEAPDVAVAGDFVEFKFSVTSKGFAGETIQVSMTDHDTSITPMLDVKLEGKEKEVEQAVLMKWKPERPGEYTVKVATPVRAEEIVEGNNELVHHIRIVDNKIKVLFVEGYPRWEYRYLKNALVRDKSMLVDVLLLSADESFPQEGSPGRTPLTEFPAEKKQLAEYDVIILGDVNPRDMRTSTVTSQQVWDNLVTYVEELGGGLVMIAGEVYAPKEYADTPIARLLPVSVDRTSASPAIMHDEPVRVELTPFGKESPLMRLVASMTPEENVELWQDADGKGDGLPGFYWFYRARSPKAGATVLATHPSYEVENGQRLPVFCYQRVGRGICFFSAVDSTWRWRYLRGDQYFYTFWGQVMRHCRSGKLIGSKRFQIELDKNSYSLMDRVRIKARVLDKEYEPLHEPTYTVTLTAPDQMPVELELKAEENPSNDLKKMGWFAGDYQPSRLGWYELALGPRGLDDTDPKTIVKFNVEEPNRENENPMMDAQTLIKVSETTRGKFLPFYEVDKLLSTIKETGEIVDIETKEQDLWDTPLVFILFAALITVEWVIRKMVRLV